MDAHLDCALDLGLTTDLDQLAGLGEAGGNEGVESNLVTSDTLENTTEPSATDAGLRIWNTAGKTGIPSPCTSGSRALLMARTGTRCGVSSAT